ncbi:MBL fold metallo-hydrolase [Paenibacillus koleovorans]|uniref:MBL fold metallo-hydrolase n=1 Tax=Paenibacillus koleovorans TaxID=121608 RepID=UPI000FD91E64|nr:MBL fold metallo-hydrolase [Paenibacillus koleovorans]
MKVQKISDHIWSLGIWVVIPVHIWLVEEEDGFTLVDAGIPMMAKGIGKAIQEIGAGLKPLKQVLLTHGHSDHVGAILKLREAHPDVPVYVHRLELPHMEGRQPYPGRKKAAASLPPGLAQPLPESADGSLLPVSGLTPYHTPGHAPGHVAYYHEADRVLLAGDLFTSRRGRLHRPMPMFTADMSEAFRSGAIIRELRPERLEVCHGASVIHPADHWDDYARAMKAKYNV